MKTMTYDEWKAEGTRLFGDDMMKWRFRCPACGHVAAVEDFRQFKDQGAQPDKATQECISPLDLLRSLTVADIRDRLAKAEAEADALRVLLRSARARERRLPQPSPTKGVAHA